MVIMDLSTPYVDPICGMSTEDEKSFIRVESWRLGL